ncbi:glycosyltransferase family 2 protein [Stenoxybacter acetivorans]|uniref:glycosyltransferase family 2 protein n=1 Tax=Stenoxybacter acetivorans TaxID=422441 RepID=UPI00056CB57F|nr:glycosyltransferase family 2 protein [Stenoxybacter acetivorans]
MKLVALIPHYNHLQSIGIVAAAMRAQGYPVYIVDDGSDAASRDVLHRLSECDENITILQRAKNGGKGSAVKMGLLAAQWAGFTHVLQVDADAQHCLADAAKLTAAAEQQPEALICAHPLYGSDAPKSRLYGRKITNFWITVNSGSLQLKDGMCGFRVYPLAAVMPIVRREYLGNRMDFDTEILVHAHWRGIPMVWIDTPVRYIDGGVSHFRVWADNGLISKMHARLFFKMLRRRLFRQPFHE